MSTPENEKDPQKEGFELKAVKKIIAILEAQLESNIPDKIKNEKIELIRLAKEIYQLR
ncbi:hypothetical protein [Taibaiella helva]|uniref:hypothetical protein n=1 Tax=Taibaiella helva TaxID=2301235 RepID=UPI0013003203|nr:hypothetical protein [Taibaiella helva]